MTKYIESDQSPKKQLCTHKGEIIFYPLFVPYKFQISIANKLGSILKYNQKKKNCLHFDDFFC